MNEPVGLFDIVSWEYGFVHSGAVAWLLSQPRLAARVLNAAGAAPWDPSVRLTSEPLREAKIGRRSADLSFTVAWEGHGSIPVAFETKVQDLLDPDQITAYRAAGHQPLLYMPGLTGLLAIRNPTSGADEALLTGDMLCDALLDAYDEMPAVIRGYLDTVRRESERFAAARAHAEGNGAAFGPGATPTEALLDVAWIVAVLGELQTRYERDCRSTRFPVDRLATRDVAFDRGFFWADTHTVPTLDVGQGKVGFYIDVVAVKASSDRSVIIKAGFDDNPATLGAAFDYAEQIAPPSNLWSRGRRRLTGESVTCWRAPATDLSASDGAELAVQAASWIRALP